MENGVAMAEVKQLMVLRKCALLTEEKIPPLKAYDPITLH
jgi:hypothetical protein